MKFYKETNFKEEAEFGSIPKDWEIKKVGALFKVETGTTPSTKRFDYWNGGNINWFTPMDLSKLNERILIKESERKITPKALKECNLTILPKGSIILSTRAPVGYVAVLEKEGTFNQGCKGLIPKDKEKVNSRFYAYYLWFKNRKLQHLSGGSTFKELSKHILENLKVPLPPFFEQYGIVEVLFSFDLAIHKVNEAIIQAECLKKGLMQQLLTKGIGHKEFKQTPIGKIPREWKVVKIEDVAEPRREIVSPIDEDPSTPYVGLEHVDPGDIRINRLGKTSEVKSAKFRFSKNDILYGKLRPYLDKAVLSNTNGVCSTDFIVIKSRKTIIPDFLIWILHTKRFVNYATSTMTGTNHPRTSWSSIARFITGLPTLHEQQKIAEILYSVDFVLRLKKNKRKKLVRMKRQLMNSLLTGKIRVSG
jgi:type I restriction enzyme S subunit